jgi:hypothetical protein
MRTLPLFVASYLAVGVISVSAQTQATEQVRAPGARLSVRTAGASNLLPGARRSVLTIIQGNALDSSNGALQNSLVRLRDARVGRIVDNQSTDKTGLFTFRGVDPGMYVVEVAGRDSKVLATSQVISLNAGEVISTIVKLPFEVPAFASLLGQTTQLAAAQSVVAAAASTGVLTTGPRAACVTGPCQ